MSIASGYLADLSQIHDRCHVLRAHTTRFRPSTTTRPVTDRIVSMIDQLLMVWTTDSPKNSLTSQNPRR